MKLLSELSNSLLHIVFPDVCKGCGSDVLDRGSQLCLRCLTSLPETGFHLHRNNPVEKIFWGRVPIVAAMSQFYFTKESLIQHLMHQFKYRGERELGRQLGKCIGSSLLSTNRFSGISGLIPLPLFRKKEKLRGYNQAQILCEGIGEITGIPVVSNVLKRTIHTDTQTHKGRVERWKNMEGKFVVHQKKDLIGKHVLLVDDVVTTGATLEASALALLETEDVSVSIATLCVATMY